MEIRNYNELVGEIEESPSGSYVLLNDIVCPDTGQRPICDKESPFTGTLDGKGYAIRNLKLSDENVDNAGLFGYCNGASIMNLAVEGTVTGKFCVGGIAGRCEDTSFKNCFVNADITTKYSSAGGIVGELIIRKSNNCSIDSCFHSGTIIAEGIDVGGLCGAFSVDDKFAFEIKNSYHVGDCKAADRVGGLIGHACVAEPTEPLISKCYALGNVECTEMYSTNEFCIGGLVGYNVGVTISDSLALCSTIDASAVQRPHTHPIMPKYDDEEHYKIINSYAWRGMTLRTTLKGIVYGRSPTDVDMVGWAELSSGEDFYKEKLGWDFKKDWAIRNGDYPFPKIRCDYNTPMQVKVQPISFKLESRFPQGYGSDEETAFLILEPEQFDMIRENRWSFFKIGADLDFTGYKSMYTSDGRFLPIGDAENPFFGNIDGTGDNGRIYKITGLDMDFDDIADAGLFGCVGETGRVTGLDVSGTVKGKSNTGLIAGYNLGSITGCCAGGVIEGGTAGGIAGTNFGTITDCFTVRESVVCGTSSAGGIAGENCGVIERCYVRCAVKSAQSLGGIAGIHYKLPDGGRINKCVAAHRPEFLKNAGKTYYGSIAGENLNTVSNNYVWDEVAQTGDMSVTIEVLTERSFWVKQGYMKEAVGESDLWKWDGDFPYL